MTKYIMTTQSEDRIGIVAALTTCLSEHSGFITELAQFGTPTSEGFFSRIEFKIDDRDYPLFQGSIESISKRLSLDVKIAPKSHKTKTLLMVSKFDQLSC